MVMTAMTVLLLSAFLLALSPRSRGHAAARGNRGHRHGGGG